MKHWKQHKSECTWIKEIHDEWKEGRNIVLPEGTQLDTKEGPCAICLEETITNPVVLPCGHVFCFRCMGSYQGSSNSTECPYCRGEIPNVGEKAAERMSLYSKRAEASPKGSDECIKYAKLALAENQAITELMEKDEFVEMLLKMKFIRAELTSMTDQPLETLNIAKEVLSLNEKHPGILDSTDVADIKCLIAEAYAALGNWGEAVEIYWPAYVSYVQNGVIPHIGIIFGSCKAMYETRCYDKVIEVGKQGIKYKREFPGVHRYVALSQKAKGDIDGAKLTMSQSILYEYHWDKDNLQKNKQILRELDNL